MAQLRFGFVLSLAALFFVACGPASGGGKTDDSNGASGTVSGGVTGTLTKANLSASNIGTTSDWKTHVDIAGSTDDKSLSISQPGGEQALLTVSVSFKGDLKSGTYTDADSDLCAESLLESISSNDFDYMSAAPSPCNVGSASAPLGSFKLTLSSVSGPDAIGSYVVHGSFNATTVDQEHPGSANTDIAVTF